MHRGQVSAHDALGCGAVTRGNHGNNLGMIFMDGVTILRSSCKSTQITPIGFVPNSLYHIEQRQHQAVSGTFRNLAVKGAVPQFPTIIIHGYGRFFCQPLKRGNVVSAAADGGDACQRRLDLQARFHNLQRIGSFGEIAEKMWMQSGTLSHKGSLTLLAPDQALRLQHFHGSPNRPPSKPHGGCQVPLRRQLQVDVAAMFADVRAQFFQSYGRVQTDVIHCKMASLNETYFLIGSPDINVSFLARLSSCNV